MSILNKSAIRLLFPLFSSFPKPHYSLSQLESSNLLYLLGTGKTSSSTMEKVQKEPSVHEESSSSDQEQDQEIFFPPSQAQVVPNMFMPYIEGPKMDWTVNDGLYHRFLKWHLVLWKHPWVWPCDVTWEKAMQEDNYLEWWFWHGPVCFLEHV